MRTRVRTLALLSRLRIQHCCELWFRLRKWPGSRVAVAVAVAVAWASSYSSDSTLSLGTSICLSAALKRPKKEKKSLRLSSFKYQTVNCDHIVSYIYLRVFLHTCLKRQDHFAHNCSAIQFFHPQDVLCWQV